MRIRYQYAGDRTWSAECDMTERKARNRFEKLKTDALCMWGELVAEDDENYMGVLESFDKTRDALMFERVCKELGLTPKRG